MNAWILMNAWVLAGLAVALYCIARGVVDLRQRRFVWGALGIVSGLVLMTTPIQSHAVKYDLPVEANSQR
jgi:hypothetical protein